MELLNPPFQVGDVVEVYNDRSKLKRNIKLVISEVKNNTSLTEFKVRNPDGEVVTKSGYYQYGTSLDYVKVVERNGVPV